MAKLQKMLEGNLFSSSFTATVQEYWHKPENNSEEFGMVIGCFLMAPIDFDDLL